MARRRLGFWRRLAVGLVKPTNLALIRRDWRGMENIPREGGVILAVNHISHADPLPLAEYVYDAGRWPVLLGKASLFKIPVLGKFIAATGQIPVYRGTANAGRSLEEAVRAVNNGDSVIFYPEGTITKQPEHWPMRGKTGVARLALATGAPVVPIAQWGAQELYDPITKKRDLAPRKLVTIVAGKPVDLGRWKDAPQTAAVFQEVTDEIMYAVRGLLEEIRGELAPELHTPGSEA